MFSIIYKPFYKPVYKPLLPDGSVATPVIPTGEAIMDRTNDPIEDRTNDPITEKT